MPLHHPGMRTVIIDNYDSFTYNLQHYLEAVIEADVPVYRNNQISIADLDAFDNIVLSPGPGLPQQAGITMEIIERFGSSKRILGVCLGHQAIGLAFGGSLKNLRTVHHGVSSSLHNLHEDYLFENFPHESPVGRYHSWVVNNRQLPDSLEVLATDEEGEIMALRHKTLDIRGVQFHPESVMTPHGKTLMRNWALKKQ